MILLYANFLGRVAAITASAQADPDYPLANLVDEARDTCARTLSTANQHIQFDIALSAPPCDYFFIDRGHNLAGATVRLVGSGTQDFASPDQIFSLTASGDSAIFRTFTQETYQYYRLYLESLSAAPSIFGVYFGKSASLEKYPAGPCRPDIVRSEKTLERFESGRKRLTVHYSEHRIDYEWPRISPAQWSWFETLERETEHLTRPFWLKWENQHAEPVFFISEDDRLDWQFVDGLNKSVKLSAEEYL